MKKLTLSLWLALAAAGIFALQAMPARHNTAGVLPFQHARRIVRTSNHTSN